MQNEKPKAKLKLGNCLDILKTMPDNYVDSIVTDPPYGLAFMGKKWDYDVPSTELWKECLRVLKPGGHLLAFGGTRTYHRLVVAIEDAGFEIRDQIQWLYGQGFPKSQDISKAIDNYAGVERQVGPIDQVRAGRLVNQTGDYITEVGWSAGNRKVTIDPPATPEAKQWSGWGTALKPANEPICLARKPLSESTIAKNVLKHGTGGLNIDGTRVDFASETDRLSAIPGDGKGASSIYSSGADGTVPWKQGAGRFPANVIFDEDAAKVLDGQTGILKIGARKASVKKDSGVTFQTGGVSPCEASEGGASRFFKIIEKDITCDQNDLSTAALVGSSFKHDETLLSFVQEAVRTSCSKDPLLSHCLASIPDYKKCILYQDLAPLAETPESIDTTLIMRSLLKLFGSARLVTDENIKSAKNEGKESTEYVPTKFLYQSKASKSDRGDGNTHPTVKPVKLMEYLITLITPPNGIVLDPFMGSGTTGVAAANLSVRFVGCEMSDEYFEIAKKRIENA